METVYFEMTNKKLVEKYFEFDVDNDYQSLKSMEAPKLTISLYFDEDSPNCISGATWQLQEIDDNEPQPETDEDLLGALSYLVDDDSIMTEDYDRIGLDHNRIRLYKLGQPEKTYFIKSVFMECMEKNF